MKKCVFLVILVALIGSSAKSQTSTQTKVFFEKVFVRTDRQIYVAGETLWYSAFLVNAQDNHFLNTSNTLYAELASTNKDYHIQKQIIQLKEGKGYGDFELEDTLEPGNYLLRAWTNWMRNFGDNFIFEKKIIVVSPPKASNSKDKPKTASGTNSNKPITSSNKIKKALIQFLPEGGSLLNDVASVVAFKTDGGESVNGSIVNSKGELITVLENKQGVGTFLLKPVSGETYYAKGQLSNGQEFNKKLPMALSKGYSMHINEKDSLYQIIISTNEISNLKDKDVLLVGKSHGIECFKVQFPLRSLTQAVKVYKDKFPGGIVALTLYDAEGRPNCERLVYTEHPIKQQVTLTVSKDTQQTDQGTKITVKINGQENRTLQGTFSVAVLNDAFSGDEKSNIASYLMLESELKGRVENPKQYFDENNPLRKKQLDLLMLTQGWRDFLWKNILDTAFVITHIPESGITVSGSVKRKIGDKPIPSSNVTIRSIGESQSQLFSGTTDKNGNFYFDNAKFIGEQTFKVNAVNKKINNEGWITLDPLFKPVSFVPDEQETKDDSLQRMANEIRDQYAVIQKTKPSIYDRILLEEVKVKDGKPILVGDILLNDFGYKDENFTISPADSSYQSLSHYLLTNSKQAAPDSGSNNYIVFHHGTSVIYPRFIVNNKSQDFMEYNFDDEDANTEIRDNIYDTYLNLSMSEITYVTIKHLVRGTESGPKDYFLVYLTLKEGSTLGAKGNPIVAILNGYYQAKQFYPADSDNKQQIDRGITLYWNPIIETDENGEATFYFHKPTKSKLRLNIQGVSSLGNPFVTETIINKP
ncbi:MAG TPA: hypothetical protein VL125_05810 [Pelobium sp.]|nr:hypothetical protein [Pelobium sp.]